MAEEHVRELRTAVRQSQGAGAARSSGRLASLRARLRRTRPALDETDPFAALEGVTIRRSSGADRAALQRLAQLDSRRLADGELLVAEVDGELRAALPLGGGGAIADPFRPTAALVSLLAMRAAQLRASEDREIAPAAGSARLVAVPRH